MGHKGSEGVLDARPCRTFTIALPLTKRRKGETRRGSGLILSLVTGVSMRVI